jgi:hypothetical protein
MSSGGDEPMTRSLSRGTCLLRGPCRIYIYIESLFVAKGRVENWIRELEFGVQKKN